MWMMGRKGKSPGRDVPDNSDELLSQLILSQLKANYRKSLGKEFVRRSRDVEVKKAFERRGRED
jgi:hypothetical protein